MPHEEANIGYTPKVGVVTISESRYIKYMRNLQYSDPSGDLAERILRNAGFKDIVRELVGDKDWLIINTVKKLVRRGCELIFLIGGTGVSKGDVTKDALECMLDKKLDLYPVAYTLESYGDVGSRVLSSRPVAGFYGDTLVISMPGNPDAVETVLKNVLKNEYIHLLWLNKFGRI